MGRKTFESIGRPLPGRTNIVISSNSDYQADGIELVGDLRSAIDLALSIDQAPFIIGGASIYHQAYPLADKLYLTIVDCELEGDAFFELPNENQWTLLESETHLSDEKHKFNYTFKIFERKA